MALSHQEIEALRAAGFSDEQIAKEIAFAERVALENERIRSDRAWNYGIHHADDEYEHDERDDDDGLSARERELNDRLDMGRNEAGEWLGFC